MGRWRRAPRGTGCRRRFRYSTRVLRRDGVRTGFALGGDTIDLTTIRAPKQPDNVVRAVWPHHRRRRRPTPPPSPLTYPYRDHLRKEIFTRCKTRTSIIIMLSSRRVVLLCVCVFSKTISLRNHVWPRAQTNLYDIDKICFSGKICDLHGYRDVRWIKIRWLFIPPRNSGNFIYF